MAVNLLEFVSQLYVIYFARPADPAGLEFWRCRLADFDELADGLNFFDHGTELEGGIDKNDFLAVICALTQNAFNRAPSAREYAYYYAQLSSSHWCAAQVARALVETAKNGDALVLQEKCLKAQFFTSEVAEGRRQYNESHLGEARAYLME